MEEYVMYFYGRQIDGQFCLICKNTGISLPHSKCLEFLALCNTELEMSGQAPNAYLAIFNTEDDYNSYLNYCVFVG